MNESWIIFYLFDMKDSGKKVKGKINVNLLNVINTLMLK